MGKVHLFVLIMISAWTFQSRSSTIIYRPGNPISGKPFIVSDKSFTDSRVSFDGGKSVNYWLVKREGVQIEQFFEHGKLTKFHAHQYSPNQVKEISYILKDGSYVLDIYSIRRPEVYNLDQSLFSSDEKSLCDVKTKVFEELNNISKSVNSEICKSNLESGIVDQSCKTTFSEKEYSSLIRALTNQNNVAENNTFTCMRSPATAGILSLAYKQPLVRISNILQIVAAKYEINALKVQNDPKSLAKKIICKASPTRNPLAQTIEGNKIVFYSSKEEPKVEVTKNQFLEAAVHEGIHDAGVKIDRIVRDIADLCFKGLNSVPPISDAENKCINGGKCGTGIISQLASENSMAKTAEQVPVKIPKQVAESTFGNPPSKVLDQPITDSGKANKFVAENGDSPSPAFLEKTFEQSTGPFRTATQLFNLSGITPVSQALAAQNSGSGARAPASIATSSTVLPSKVTSSKVKKAATADEWTTVETVMAPTELPQAVLSTKLASDENSKSSDARKLEGNIRRVDNGGGGKIGSSTPGSAAPIKNTAGALSARSPASVSKGITNSKSASANSKRMSLVQVKTILGKYDVAKDMLKDPKFREQVKENKIAITDYSGNVIVERTQDSLVYIDNGKEFAPTGEFKKNSSRKNASSGDDL